MSHKPRVVEIGPYTAIGGVSVHIKRLTGLLDDDYSFSIINESPVLSLNKNGTHKVIHLRKAQFYGYVSLILKSSIVHIHSGIWWLRCIHVLTAKLFGKPVVVTVHSLSNIRTGFVKWITHIVLKLASTVIVVNSNIKKALKADGSIVLHAYLPADLGKEEELDFTLKNILEKNLEKKVIVSNAFKIVFHNNQDLYGLDLLIDVARQAVIKEKRDWLIIFVIASPNTEIDIVRKYQDMIKEEGLGRFIIIIERPISFVKLIKESSVVVRATNTDGDALTVREALGLGIPVISSDVVARPKGSILFKNRNPKDLFDKLEKVLDEGFTLEQESISNKINTYNNVYHNLIELHETSNTKF